MKGNQTYKLLNILGGSLLIVSGIANIFIIKAGKSLKIRKYKMWIHFFELKFILALLLTPSINMILKYFFDDFEAQEDFRVKF